MTDVPKPDDSPVPPAPVDPPVDPPTDPVDPPKSDAADGVAAVVATLGEKIDSLAEVVKGLIPDPGDSIDTPLPGHGKPVGDDNPGKPPWHKRGMFN